MLFQTPEFVIFTVIILALYYLTPKHRLSLLAVVNILFYVIGGLGYLLLFMIIAMLTYLCSLHLHRKIRKVVSRSCWCISQRFSESKANLPANDVIYRL